MNNQDFSYEASLTQQYKQQSGKKVYKQLPTVFPVPFWVELIHDLVFGAGFSYSRIAYRIKVSPSTIQKLATNYQRKPRSRILQPLSLLHHKVFEGPYATPKAREYWIKKQRI